MLIRQMKFSKNGIHICLFPVTGILHETKNFCCYCLKFFLKLKVKNKIH